jgi:hypothetical protein
MPAYSATAALRSQLRHVQSHIVKLLSRDVGVPCDSCRRAATHTLQCSHAHSVSSASLTARAQHLPAQTSQYAQSTPENRRSVSPHTSHIRYVSQSRQEQDSPTSNRNVNGNTKTHVTTYDHTGFADSLLTATQAEGVWRKTFSSKARRHVTTPRYYLNR